MYTRPSKNFFFPLLRREIWKVRGGFGLDAASAGMKNRQMFNTKVYIGLDIDEQSLKRGLLKETSQNTCGMLGDVTKLDTLPSQSFRLVVSTNTLDHLKNSQITDTVKSLSRLVEKDGYFLYQMTPMREPDFDETVKWLKTQYKDVRIIYYNNPISSAYERFFETKGELSSHPIASTRPFIALSYLISRLELLTSKFRLLNEGALVICSNKIATGRIDFNLQTFVNVAPRLYKL